MMRQMMVEIWSRAVLSSVTAAGGPPITRAQLLQERSRLWRVKAAGDRPARGAAHDLALTLIALAELAERSHGLTRNEAVAVTRAAFGHAGGLENFWLHLALPPQVEARRDVIAACHDVFWNAGRSDLVAILDAATIARPVALALPGGGHLPAVSQANGCRGILCAIRLPWQGGRDTQR